jgi:stage II sporulation protein D
MSSSLGVINRVGIDAYIKGVVPSEVPTSWPASALQAQALAARSYAIATRKPGSSFDLYADTRSQVYRGIDEEEPSTNAAVDATAGQAILHNGKVIPAFFSSTSGGRTAAINDVWNSAPRAYLESVPDPYERSPYSVWPEKIGYSPGSLARALGVRGTVRSIDTALNGSSRVSKLNIRTTRGRTSVTGPQAQLRLKLRSTYFRVERLELAVRSRRGSRVSLGGTAPSGGVTELWIRPSGSTWTLAKKLEVKQGGFRARVRLRRTSDIRLKRNGWFGPGMRLNP